MNIDEFLNAYPEHKSKVDEMTDEERQQLCEWVDNIERTVHALFSVAKRVVESYSTFLSAYRENQVVHLALHGRKKRTRKKNMSRLQKDMKRWCNNG